MLTTVTEQVFDDPNSMDIRYAAQLFGYSSKLARQEIDCPVAQGFLNELEDDVDYIVDSRAHMLMPGWLPCIGGWHFDEVARDQNKNLHWDSNKPKEHYFMIIDQGTGSLTEFAQFDWPRDQEGCVMPRHYEELSEWIKYDSTKIIHTCESNKIYSFDCFDAHRGTPATGHGWRYFIRATANTQRTYANEIRKQTQVYIPSESVGW
jgi:hypothetical protein